MYRRHAPKGYPIRSYGRVLRGIYKGMCFSPSLMAYAHLIHKISFYFGKTLESLHMCNFCCTFALETKSRIYERRRDTRDLIRNSYEIVKAKYTKKK